MNTVEEFLDHPQLRRERRWREVDSPAGPIRALVPPFGLDDIEPGWDAFPTSASTPTRSLRELGYDAATIANGVATA